MSGFYKTSKYPESKHIPQDTSAATDLMLNLCHRTLYSINSLEVVLLYLFNANNKGSKALLFRGKQVIPEGKGDRNVDN